MNFWRKPPPAWQPVLRGERAPLRTGPLGVGLLGRGGASRGADAEIIVNELENKSGVDPEDEIPKQRVSRGFLLAMKNAVIAMTSEKATDFSARVVYSRMQMLNSGLAAPFDASNVSHGKRELQSVGVSGKKRSVNRRPLRVGSRNTSGRLSSGCPMCY
jgi:hypothetical protein